MWNELAIPWQACLTLAWQSYSEGSVPIGAVVVDSYGSILSRGRNRGSSPAESSSREIVGGPLAHAEVNALLLLDRPTLDFLSVELLTTVEPCPLCIGAVCMSRIKRIKYAARDTWSGSTNLLRASAYLRWKSIEALPLGNHALETVVHMLQVDAQPRSNHPRVEEVLATWSQHYPEDVQKGRALFASDELQRMRLDSASADTVTDYLFDLST